MKMKELKKIGIYKWPKAIGHLFASYTYTHIYIQTHTHYLQTNSMLSFLFKEKKSTFGYWLQDQSAFHANAVNISLQILQSD